LRDEIFTKEKSKFQGSNLAPSRNVESMPLPSRDLSPRNFSGNRPSRDDTLSCLDEDSEGAHHEGYSTNNDGEEEYQTPMESTRKLIHEFRKSTKQTITHTEQPSNILGTLALARSRSRPLHKDYLREEPAKQPQRVVEKDRDYDKENYGGYNYRQKNVNLKEVRLSNDSFGPSKSAREGEYESDYGAPEYESSQAKRPYLRSFRRPEDESDFETNGAMPGDCWPGSRQSSHRRPPLRDDSQFYSHMSEAESRCLDWE
jgi:hypothetical protein